MSRYFLTQAPVEAIPESAKDMLPIIEVRKVTHPVGHEAAGQVRTHNARDSREHVRQTHQDTRVLEKVKAKEFLVSQTLNSCFRTCYSIIHIFHETFTGSSIIIASTRKEQFSAFCLRLQVPFRGSFHDHKRLPAHTPAARCRDG